MAKHYFHNAHRSLDQIIGCPAEIKVPAQYNVEPLHGAFVRAVSNFQAAKDRSYTIGNDALSRSYSLLVREAFNSDQEGAKKCLSRFDTYYESELKALSTALNIDHRQRHTAYHALQHPGRT